MTYLKKVQLKLLKKLTILRLKLSVSYAINSSEWKVRLVMLKKDLKDLRTNRENSEQLIPDKLTQLGVSDIKLNDGSRISADPFYSARISVDNTEAAHGWLRDNGHGDIIKNTLTLTFGQGEDAVAKELGELLASKGHLPEKKAAVHPSTLKAFVKEQIESGNGAFDQDIQKKFSVYQGKRTKINR